MYIKLRIRNILELSIFYGKYIFLIAIPILLFLFKNVIYDFVKPSIVENFPSITTSVNNNAKSINDIFNILLGAFIPFVGTWMYNSSKTRGKNACYKKEIFYKGMYKDLYDLSFIFGNDENKKRGCRTPFEFWGEFKDTIPAMCINKTLRKYINNHYKDFFNITENIKEFNLLYIKKVYQYLEYDLKDGGNYFFCRPLYQLARKNDEAEIKSEIKMLFNRENIKERKDINEIYSELFGDIRENKQYCKISHDIDLFNKNNSELLKAVKYLIGFINKHYEAGNNLA